VYESREIEMLKITKKHLNKQKIMISECGDYVTTGHWLIAKSSVNLTSQPEIVFDRTRTPPAHKLLDQIHISDYAVAEITDVLVRDRRETSVVLQSGTTLVSVSLAYEPILKFGLPMIRGDRDPVIVVDGDQNILAVVMQSRCDLPFTMNKV